MRGYVILGSHIGLLSPPAALIVAQNACVKPLCESVKEELQLLKPHLHCTAHTKTLPHIYQK